MPNSLKDDHCEKSCRYGVKLSGAFHETAIVSISNFEH